MIALESTIFWNWEIWFSCNYRCPYCQFTLQGFDRGMRVNVFPGFKRLGVVWKRVREVYGNCLIQFSGAEPTLYPNFIELLQMLTQWHTVELHTNLSFDVQRFAERVDLRKVRIAASFHPLFARFEEFLQKALYLQQRNISAIGVTYVPYPEQLEKMAFYSQEFRRAGVGFVIHPYHGTYKGRVFPGGYTEDERKLLDEAMFRDGREDAEKSKNRWEWEGHPQKVGQDKIIAERTAQNGAGNSGVTLLDPPPDTPPEEPLAPRPPELSLPCKKQPRLCQMGQRYAHIVPNGDVYRCCYHSSRPNQAGSRDWPSRLGNLFYDDDFVLLDQPKLCEVVLCPCDKCMVVGEESRWRDKWETPDMKLLFTVAG